MKTITFTLSSITAAFLLSSCYGPNGPKTQRGAAIGGLAGAAAGGLIGSQSGNALGGAAIGAAAGATGGAMIGNSQDRRDGQRYYDDRRRYR